MAGRRFTAGGQRKPLPGAWRSAVRHAADRIAHVHKLPASRRHEQAEPVVEIFQGHRGSYEDPAGPGAVRRAIDEGWVTRAWNKGYRLGVIAASDHTSTHQSLACIYAPELTIEALQEGLKQRLCFAATDNIIVKVVAVTLDGAPHLMGREIRSASPPELQVEIEGTDTLETVEVIRDGRIVLTRQPGAKSDNFRFRDNTPLDGDAYYYIRLVQSNRMIAWSSPVWVAN